MPLIIAVFVALGLIGLNCVFIINARTLLRDVNQRRDAFRARLENDANAIVDELFKANEADGVPPSPRATPQ